MAIIGSLVGGLGGGLLGGLLGGGEDPTYEQQSLNPTEQAGLNKISQRAERSVEDRTNAQMQGTQDAANPYLNFSKEYGSQGNMNDALQARLERQSASDLSKLRRQTAIGAGSQKLSDLFTDQAFKQQKYQLDTSQSNFMLQAAQNKEMLRNQVIGSIIGSVGTFGGMALGGAFKGAATQPAPFASAGGGQQGSFSFANNSSVPSGYNSSLGKIGG